MKNKNSGQVNPEAIIDTWFLKTVHNTIIQRDAELYNKFHAAAQELKKLLGVSVPAAEPVKEEI